MYYDIVNSGERIKELRAARRMTRQQLAEQIGLSVDALRKIEAGVNGAKIDTLISIAELFHITLDYLVCGCERKAEVDDLLVGLKEKEVQFMEHIKKKHLEASKPKADVPNKPDNILVYKTKCACCGGSVLIGRHHTYSEKFYYKCKNRRKLARLCENKYSYDYSEVMDSVFSVIRQHMSLCVEKTKFVQKMNSRKENVLQYDIYTKQIAKLQNDVRRITANKSGLYEDYREQLITAEELCQYQREYESRVNEIEAQITELLHRRSLYEKEFHIDEGWEETVNKYMAKRKLTKELVDAFVSEIVFYDGNIEVKLLYDDFLKELLKVAEEREVSSNG